MLTKKKKKNFGLSWGEPSVQSCQVVIIRCRTGGIFNRACLDGVEREKKKCV